jgi:hypothetical protein
LLRSRVGATLGQALVSGKSARKPCLGYGAITIAVWCNKYQILL